MKNAMQLMMRYVDIMQVVKSSDVMERQWNDYRKDFNYAAGIEFADVCDAITEMMDRLRNVKEA